MEVTDGISIRKVEGRKFESSLYHEKLQRASEL